MGVETNLGEIIQELEASEIATLLKIYYNKDGIVKKIDESEFNERILQDLLNKNLVQTDLIAGDGTISLTDEGLNICGSIMFDRIKNKDVEFTTEIQYLPQRVVACLVNRILWNNNLKSESDQLNNVIEPYALDESLWYERVLLYDERIINTLEKFYNILEDFDFVKTTHGERWCSPEVEKYLKDQYNNLMDLTWTDEDALKYYYFFYIYAQDQKNLIAFSNDDEQIRSMFYGEGNATSGFYISANRSNPHTLLYSLGLSEKRAIGFLEEMQKNQIASERYYPMSSFSFFNDNDKIYVINDIKGFMDYIAKKFLSPVVDSLLK